MTKTLRSVLLLVVLGLALIGPSALAQEPPPGGGRPKFQRDQGTPEALSAAFTQLMGALKANDQATAARLLKGFQPDEAALRDAFTAEGYGALGQRLLESAGTLFSGEVPQICERLAIAADQEQVIVHTATTEDLLTMESESVAAIEFASGLRRTARLLKERYRWYAVVLRRAGEEEGGTRIQLFFFHQGRFVLLGKVWRLDT